MMARTSNAATPRVPGHVEPGSFVIDITSAPDDLGRVQFFAFWHDPHIPGDPGHVRGQVFCTVLDQFTARHPGMRITVRSDHNGGAR